MRSFVQSSAGIVHPPPPLQGTTQHGVNTTTFPCTAPILPSADFSPTPIPIPGPSNRLGGSEIDSTSFFNVQNDTLLLSTYTKDHVTRAIQGAGLNRPSNATPGQSNNSFAFVTLSTFQNIYVSQPTSSFFVPLLPLALVSMLEVLPEVV